VAPRVRLGISSCLLGQLVRYDGDHRRDAFLVEQLGRHIEWVPVCPEAELGLGVPRPTIRLEGDPAAPRLVRPSTRQDITEDMLSWAARRLDELEGAGLQGFVLKARSPSCGVAGVKVYEQSGRFATVGTGLWALALKGRFPLLELQEDEWLQDQQARARFLDRVLPGVAL